MMKQYITDGFKRLGSFYRWFISGIKDVNAKKSASFLFIGIIFSGIVAIAAYYYPLWPIVGVVARAAFVLDLLAIMAIACTKARN